MSFIVALTGGIGSGKTTVANRFADIGVPVVDADVIARQVVEPGTPALAEIARRFGPSILNADGALNRRALREIVFSLPEHKVWLNALLHPLIQQETQRQFSAIAAPYTLWVIPLLIENNLTHLADRILVVDVSQDTQLERTIQRDGVDSQLAENIINAQTPRETRLSYADDVINNDGEQNLIVKEVERLHHLYLSLAQQKAQSK